MNLREDTVISKNRGHDEAMMEDEVVLMHRESGDYFTFGETGGFIWSHLNRPITIKELCVRVMEEYRVDVRRCRRDLDNYLRDLLKSDLIRIVK